MREYQKQIYQAITNKRDWWGSNVAVKTSEHITNIDYYGSRIGIVDHAKKVAVCDNCGFHNTSTTARINVIKMAANELKYTIIEN